MPKRRALVALIAVGVSMALLAPEAAVAAPKPVVVGTDPVGDWGGNAAAPVGAELGQDLVKASIVMADKTTVNFIIEVTSLLAVGGTPEVTRYIWGMARDGNYVELDGKFTNFTRGACDPTAGCPGTVPPRNPGVGPFAIRANCVTVQQVVTCQEVGLVNATFDPGSGTITVPVPLTLLGAKPGSKLSPAPISATGFEGSLAAISSAFFTVATIPHDDMLITKTFVVPGKKKKK